ncbi:hypothetical protein [Mycoplasma sp. Mirounga ES2805-ORL]|uniref:hypothetical protein n=1 Tax=Mycoplasma sp. Mirounga ES2805-ORL TaxID=754514 RepID=UPI00197B2025|nr:hypothetical protein [Mycoplasma sp. Mirounga ES2805-ORL]QSF13589.1 hypothetical protein JXZ90_02905 [Mycoplasma sp. Mirounga ES2805-ORL]
MATTKAKTTTKKVKKANINKFYLSEKFDEDRNISFNVKRAKIKTLTNFPTFYEALEFFLETAEKLDGESKVWFHRDGAFRGNSTYENARIILDKVKEANVKDEEAIEFINKENLVEQTKSKTKKTEVNWDDEANKVIFSIKDIETKYAKEIVEEDIEIKSKYEVIISEINVINNNKLEIIYVVGDEDNTSKNTIKIIEGFKEGMPEEVIELNKELENTFLTADVANKEPKEIKNSDIKSNSKYNLVIDKKQLLPENKGVLITYHLENNNFESDKKQQEITNFKEKEEKIVTKEETTLNVKSKKTNKGWWWLLAISLLILTVDLILIILHVLGILVF